MSVHTPHDNEMAKLNKMADDYMEEVMKIEIVKREIPSTRQSGSTRRSGGGARWTRAARTLYYVVVEDGLIGHGPFTRKRDAAAEAKAIQQANKRAAIAQAKGEK